jgi:hypothetical protein
MAKEGGFIRIPPQAEKALIESVKKAQEFGNKFKNSLKTGPVKDDIVRYKDAADNIAVIAGQQARKGIEAEAKVLFGPLSEQALRATTAAIEANGNEANLNRFITIADNAKDSVGKAAAVFAKNNWTRLQPLVKSVEKFHEEELNQELKAGLDVEKREAYIKHVYDINKLPNSLTDKFFGGGSGGNFGFLKQRVFETLYDAIEHGYGKAIKTWDASQLVETRIKSGQQMVQDVNWLEGLRGVQDPTTKRPIITAMRKQENPETGRVNLVPPAGYESWSPFFGQNFAVHRGYRRVLNAVSAPSIVRDAELLGLPVGKFLMEGVGTLKHSLLVFDTYHAMRMSAKATSLRGGASYNKGLSLLEYSTQDLANAVKAGEITPEMMKYATDNRSKADALIKAGLNVGRVQEALYSDVIRQLPLAGTFNKWVFEKLTRGAMMESAIAELGRRGSENIKGVVKDMNTYFGNLGRQGIFRSKTFQDLFRVIFLAPMWFESMARTELGSIKQIISAPFTGRWDSLAKGTGTLLLGMFTATQIINIMFRGKPTWENEEDEHKTDAWIPGGANGFWISPFSLPMELTHDVIRYMEKGKGITDTASTILANKYSPLFRAISTAKTGRDYNDQKLSESDRWKTAGMNLLPVPLPVQPLIKKTPQGQVERQLLASAGIKAEPADSPNTILRRLANQFNYKQGKANETERPASVYGDILNALRSENADMAKQAVQELKEKHGETDKNIEQYFKNEGHVLFTGNKEREVEFLKTLTPHQQDLYKQAIAQRQAIQKFFFEQVLGKPVPVKGPKNSFGRLSLGHF